MLVSQDNGVVTTFGYDAFGNMTAKASDASTQTVMAYDAANRLVAITPASGTSATFTLDALGRFASRRLSAGGTDTYAYLGTSETVAEISNSTSGTIRSLLDLGGSRLAIRTGVAPATFTLFDHLGSLVGLLDGTRTISEATRFDGYGESVAHDGATLSPWRFRGHLDVSPNADALYDMGARFYAPAIGAFTQMDTVAGSAQDPLSMNRFLYAEGNPATLIDPSGHAACSAYADYCPVNGSTTKHTVQNTTKHVGKLKAGQSGRSWLNRRNDSRSEYRVTNRRTTKAAAPATPTASWRDRYKAVLAEVSSHPSDRDREADALRTFAEESGFVPEPWTYHEALNATGMAPVIGTPSDVANALGYATEGDWGNAALALAGVVGADIVAKGGKAVFKGAEELAVDVARAINRGEPGGWQAVKESMSPAARDYQNFAAGLGDAAAGKAYIVNGVRFDGWAAKESALIEAKGPSYTRLLKYGFGADTLGSQAKRQSDAAMKAGFPVIWRVQEQGAVEQIQAIVARRKLTNISVVWYPMP